MQNLNFFVIYKFTLIIVKNEQKGMIWKKILIKVNAHKLSLLGIRSHYVHFYVAFSSSGSGIFSASQCAWTLTYNFFFALGLRRIWLEAVFLLNVENGYLLLTVLHCFCLLTCIKGHLSYQNQLIATVEKYSLKYKHINSFHMYALQPEANQMQGFQSICWEFHWLFRKGVQ